jgi:hypothetical protein
METVGMVVLAGAAILSRLAGEITPFPPEEYLLYFPAKSGIDCHRNTVKRITGSTYP